MRQGLRAAIGAHGCEVDGPRSGAVRLHEVARADGAWGAVYGAITDAQASRIVDDLVSGRDPRSVDLPWIAVCRGADGAVVTHASSLLPSGLFWAWHGGSLVVASDPAWAAPTPRQIDGEYVRSFVDAAVVAERAPFVGVHRVASATTASWPLGAHVPTLHPCIGAGVWGAPVLEGDEAIDAYLTAFDGAVDGLRAVGGRTVVAVSGGLDSTLVAATLARGTTVTDPVRGLCYVPIAHARMSLAGAVDADELALAQTLERMYASRLWVEPVVNEPPMRPLDAATTAARAGGVPSFNPANEPWLQRMRAMASADAAEMLFFGSNGNAALSYDHAYAARASAGRLRLDQLARMAQDERGHLSWATTRARVLRPMRRVHRDPAPHPLAAFGLGAVARDAEPDGDGRDAFLGWLARSVTALPAAANPAAVGGVLNADPFSARAVLDIAAAIVPAEWQVGGLPRGFARRVGAGRVPDAIRLRTRRGQQGQDAWFVVREDRDEYVDRTNALRGVPGLEALDVAALARHVAGWPWGSLDGPPWLEHVAVDRLLSVGAFVDVWAGSDARVP